MLGLKSVQGVRWDFLSVHGCRRLVRGEVWSPVVRVETLIFRLNQAPFPLSACPDLKEVIAKASEAHAFTEDRCAACVGLRSSTWMQPKVTSLPLLCWS